MMILYAGALLHVEGWTRVGWLYLAHSAAYAIRSAATTAKARRLLQGECSFAASHINLARVRVLRRSIPSPHMTFQTCGNNAILLKAKPHSGWGSTALTITG